MIKKKCESCGCSFEISKYIENWKPRRFCSKKCADEIYLFKKGHKVKEKWKEKIREKNLGRKYPELSGENHPRWKGGRIKHSRGYIITYCPSHPYAAYKNKAYILEHRLIYENWLREVQPDSRFLIKLGGQFYLRKDCVVHHKDNIASHNIIENLKGYINNKEHLGDGKHINLPKVWSRL